MHTIVFPLFIGVIAASILPPLQRSINSDNDEDVSTPSQNILSPHPYGWEYLDTCDFNITLTSESPVEATIDVGMSEYRGIDDVLRFGYKTVFTLQNGTLFQSKQYGDGGRLYVGTEKTDYYPWLRLTPDIANAQLMQVLQDSSRADKFRLYPTDKEGDSKIFHNPSSVFRPSVLVS